MTQLTKKVKETDSQNKLIVFDAKRPITVPELAEITGWSKSWIYKLHAKKMIPGASQPLGKTIFFDPEKISAWLLGSPQLTLEEVEQKVTDYITIHPTGR